MDAIVRDRLHTLRQEFEKGRQQLESLDAQRAELRDTLLRIGGAIQALDEIAVAQRGGDQREAGVGSGPMESS
jgi:prefoldin subunit 5